MTSPGASEVLQQVLDLKMHLFEKVVWPRPVTTDLTPRYRVNYGRRAGSERKKVLIKTNIS